MGSVFTAPKLHTIMMRLIDHNNWDFHKEYQSKTCTVKIPTYGLKTAIMSETFIVKKSIFPNEPAKDQPSIGLGSIF